MKAVPDQIARFAPGAVLVARHRRLRLLRHPGRAPAPLRGRRALDRRRGAPRALARTDAVKAEVVQEAIARFDIDADTPRPPPRARPPSRGRRRLRVGAALVFLEGVVVEGVVVDRPASSSHSSSSSSASASRSTSARVPEPSENRPSSKPCFSSRASRNRRARPFLGTWSPALQTAISELHAPPSRETRGRAVQLVEPTAYRNG